MTAIVSSEKRCGCSRAFDKPTALIARAAKCVNQFYEFLIPRNDCRGVGDRLVGREINDALFEIILELARVAEEPGSADSDAAHRICGSRGTCDGGLLLRGNGD